MNSTPLRVSAGELSADEIIEQVRDGRRVLVTVEAYGSESEVALRHDGTTFYCDTPTRLHRHDDEAGMRECIANMGYGRPEN